jgi:glutamyl-tRNA synthetase
MQIDPDTFNPVIVDFYREIGFLPEAILNYLLLLGWSLDGQTERFDVDEMTRLFTLDRVNKSPASFDPQKLMAFQAQRMIALPIDEKLAMVLPFAERAGWLDASADHQKLRRVAIAAGERIRVAGDILDFDFCFLADDQLAYEPKAFEKRIAKADGAADALAKFAATIDTISPWDAATTESAVKAFSEREGIGLGIVVNALRVAVTGSAVGFGMFDTLEILGPTSIRNRITRAVALASSEPSA